MSQYQIVGTVKAREFLLKDEKISSFLKYIGLFTNEIINYLMANNIQVSENHGLSNLFPHKNANALSTKIGGNRYQIKYGKYKGNVLRERSYPGMCIYYNENFFDEFAGYPRIIHEILDSPVRTNPVNILDITVEKGSASIYDFRPTILNEAAYRYAKKLSKLGFLLFDGKIMTPTESSKKILSSEVNKVWEEVKKWKYRIDVWS